MSRHYVVSNGGVVVARSGVPVAGVPVSGPEEHSSHHEVEFSDEPRVDDDEDDHHAHHHDQEEVHEEEDAQAHHYAQAAAHDHQPHHHAMRTPQPMRGAPHLDATFGSPPELEVDGCQTVPPTPPFTSTPALPQAKPKLLDASLAAMKKNLIPGLTLQCIAASIIIAYYASDSARSSFDKLATFKESAGYGFSALSTGIFGGTIPWLINQVKEEYQRRKREKFARMMQGLHVGVADVDGQPTHAPLEGIMLTGSDIPLTTLPLEPSPHDSTAGLDLLDPGKPSKWVECVFLTLFWLVKGIEIDAFYRLQALVFGSDSSFGTILVKVFVDQFVYNPIWGTPSVLAGYCWALECNFNFRIWWSHVATRQFWTWQVPECLISLWLVWVPACALIYALPGSLQIPLFNIVLCFWSLILTMLAGDK